MMTAPAKIHVLEVEMTNMIQFRYKSMYDPEQK